MGMVAAVGRGSTVQRGRVLRRPGQALQAQKGADPFSRAVRIRSLLGRASPLHPPRTKAALLLCGCSDGLGVNMWEYGVCAGGRGSAWRWVRCRRA